MFDLFGPRYQTRIIIDDCVNAMKGIKEKSVNCCVTSPPYFGLRDYGHDGQIGLEETPNQFVAKMVEVFREVRRVLRDDGTLWLNLGDSYCSTDKWGGGGNLGKNTVADDGSVPSWTVRAKREAIPGVKPKDLIGIPWMVAFALQADGWYLRQEIIWHKPNPMPESVRDRCTKSHEQIFLLTKSPRYYFDADAISEEFADARNGVSGAKSSKYSDEKAMRKDGGITNAPTRSRRNKRDVWTVATAPFKGSHFATFPPKLIEPCVLAGCPVDGLVLDPFGGSGTTAYTANLNKRHAVIIDINESAIQFTQDRLSTL